MMQGASEADMRVLTRVQYSWNEGPSRVRLNSGSVSCTPAMNVSHCSRSDWFDTQVYIWLGRSPASPPLPESPPQAARPRASVALAAMAVARRMLMVVRPSPVNALAETRVRNRRRPLCL